MPWKETRVTEERRRFIEAYFGHGEAWSMTELCDAYGISRKTGYKWVERFKQRGWEGLVDSSRARHAQSRATEEAVVMALIRERRRHPTWGPRKLLGYLGRRQPDIAWPATSTAGEILKRAGLVEPRRRRRRAERGAGVELREAQAPNAVWGVDFKGWFRTGDGRRCDPLTISDLYSRYLVQCRWVERPDTVFSRAVFERAFREFGLPEAIRSDNGTPFASAGAGGLTKLSVWWVKLGIGLERIEPGHPEQNGRHERFHRTLKLETARPPAKDGQAQQRRFDRFRRSYNRERPHEALANDCPADHYAASERSYPRRIEEVEYPGHYEVRRVRTSGEIKWRSELIYVSEALVGEPVGLEEVDDERWMVNFGPVRIGVMDERLGRFIAIVPRPRRGGGGGAAEAVDNSGRPTGDLRHPQPQSVEGNN